MRRMFLFYLREYLWNTLESLRLNLPYKARVLTDILRYLSIQVLAEIAVSNLCHHWAFLLCSVFNNIKAYWLSVTNY